MNKEKLISAVSIDLGLSREKSGKTVNALFESINKTLKKDGELVIQKFGRFKLYSVKDNDSPDKIKFTPSKKLALRVNSDFRNLKKVKIKKDLKSSEKEFKKYDVKFSYEDLPISSQDESKGWVNKNTGIQKKLISDDLVNLHKEITKDTGKKK